MSVGRPDSHRTHTQVSSDRQLFRQILPRITLLADMLLIRSPPSASQLIISLSRQAFLHKRWLVSSPRSLTRLPLGEPRNYRSDYHQDEP